MRDSVGSSKDWLYWTQATARSEFQPDRVCTSVQGCSQEQCPFTRKQRQLRLVLEPRGILFPTLQKRAWLSCQRPGLPERKAAAGQPRRQCEKPAPMQPQWGSAGQRLSSAICSCGHWVWEGHVVSYSTGRMDEQRQCVRISTNRRKRTLNSGGRPERVRHQRVCALSGGRGQDTAIMAVCCCEWWCLWKT